MRYIDNYKFIPTYTQLGVHYLLIYYYHNNQNSILISKTKKGLEDALTSMLIKEKSIIENIEIREYFEGSIVKPPLEFEERYKQEQYEQDFYEFRMALSVYNSILEKEKNELIPNSCKCANFKRMIPDIELDEADLAFYNRKPDEDDLKYHFDCANCINGYSFNFDIKELFEKDNNREIVLGTSISPLDKKQKPIFYKPNENYEKSDLKVVSINNLYKFYGNYGPHSGGIQYIKYDNEISTGNCLFFFEGEMKNIPENLIDIYNKKLEEEKSIRKEKKEKVKNSEKNINLTKYCNVMGVLSKLKLI